MVLTFSYVIRISFHSPSLDFRSFFPSSPIYNNVKISRENPNRITTMSNIYIYTHIAYSVDSKIDGIAVNEFGSRRTTAVRVNIVKKRLLTNLVTRIGERQIPTR